MFKADLFKGKRFLVTGGGTGLGRMMMEKFVELGADCVICGRPRLRPIVRDRLLPHALADIGRAVGDVIQDALRHRLVVHHRRHRHRQIPFEYGHHTPGRGRVQPDVLHECNMR